MNRDVPNQIVWIAGAQPDFYEQIAAALNIGTLHVQQTSLESGASIDVTLNSGVLPVLNSRLIVLWNNGTYDTDNDLIIDRGVVPNTITITPAPDPEELPLLLSIVAFV